MSVSPFGVRLPPERSVHFCTYVRTDILASGEEALTLFRAGLKNYKAVAAQIRETDPNFPVVYMSGAHADEWASKGVPNSIMLAKPFAPAQLVTAFRNC